MPEDGEKRYYTEDVLGTKYPFFNVKQGTFAQDFSTMKRAMSGMNPFALQ